MYAASRMNNIDQKAFDFPIESVVVWRTSLARQCDAFGHASRSGILDRRISMVPLNAHLESKPQHPGVRVIVVKVIQLLQIILARALNH